VTVTLLKIKVAKAVLLLEEPLWFPHGLFSEQFLKELFLFLSVKNTLRNLKNLFYGKHDVKDSSWNNRCQ